MDWAATSIIVGSHNAVNEDYGHKHAGKWIDLSGRFTGPVVAQFQQLFCEDWAFDTDQTLSGGDLFPALEPTGEIAAQLVPTGPNNEGESFRRVLIAALAAAQRHIIMTTPYLVPDEPTLIALAMAADRGVKVDLVVPRRSDHPIVAAAGRYYAPAVGIVRGGRYPRGTRIKASWATEARRAPVAGSNIAPKQSPRAACATGLCMA